MTRHTSKLLALFLTITNPAMADENLWIYTRGVETRPANSWELKLANISRIDKNSGDYIFNEIKPEIEYGVTDRLTIAASAIIFDHHYRDVEWAPMVDTQGGPGGSFDKTQLGGIETGLKYNILSPFKDFIGLSLGFIYEHRQAYRLDGARINQDSYVPVLYLQKNWFDDTLVWAFRGKMELERRKSPGVLEEEIAFDLASGISYRIARNSFIGVEARWQSDFLSPEIDGNPPEGRPSSWDFGRLPAWGPISTGLLCWPVSALFAEKLVGNCRGTLAGLGLERGRPCRVESRKGLGRARARACGFHRRLRVRRPGQTQRGRPEL